jgi:hypothetical protein
MRLPRIFLGALALLLLAIVPVNGAPLLQKGSQTSYSLSLSISFDQSCQPILGSTLSTGIVCPMIAMVSPSSTITGTLGWTVTGLNSTTAILNVTRDTATSNGDVTTTIQHIASFNESINLATRVATILPFIEPEMNQALQMAQTNMATTLTTGTSWESTMSAVDGVMMRLPLHTMWWVNGPLKANDTVPVLLFPTNVTGSTTLDLGGSLGSRSAWTLAFLSPRSLLPGDPMTSMTTATPIADSFTLALTFNYDQTSDLLLTANADIHFGFGEEGFIPTAPCSSSTTTSPALTVCPDTTIPIMREFGIDVQASLKLTSTSLDLRQPMTQTVGSDSIGGSNSGGASGTGSAPGSGSGPGGSSNFGPNSSPGGGYNPGSGSTTTGDGQPTSNPAQSKPAAQSAGLLPWMYGILGIIAAVIVASAVWIARSRTKKAASQVGLQTLV